LFIKEIWQYPAFEAYHPDEQKDRSSEGDEAKDENQQRYRHVPDEDFEEVRPDREAGAGQKANNEARCHKMAKFFVPLVYPGEIR
jgi:hypothetical protein